MIDALYSITIISIKFQSYVSLLAVDTSDVCTNIDHISTKVQAVAIKVIENFYFSKLYNLYT